MKLEFNSLNSLLHAALTYLCDEDCIIPGGANLPVGTQVKLEMSWPEGEQPILVKGKSGGLDPAGRGLRLDLEDPGALHQIVMIMTHLHFGPKVGRQLLDLFNLETRTQDQITTAPPRPAEAVETEPPSVTELPDESSPQRAGAEDADDRRTALPKPQRMSKGSQAQKRPTAARPPRSPTPT